MKRFKKTMRLFGLVVLIILGCLGIGLGGTPPVLPAIRTKPATEFLETKEEEDIDEDVQNLR